MSKITNRRNSSTSKESTQATYEVWLKSRAENVLRCGGIGVEEDCSGILRSWSPARCRGKGSKERGKFR